MKVLITNYTFVAASKTITFGDYGSIVLDSVLLITNVTDGIVIYQFNVPAKGGSVATNVLTLDHDTTAMADADDLQIWYDDTAKIADVGSLTETSPGTDTASSGLNGRLQRIAQRLTSLITALGSPFQAGGSIGNSAFGATQSGTWTVQPGNTANTTAWKVDGSAVTQPVSVASIPSHAVTNAGTFAVQAASAGDVAHDGADSGNPIKIGGKAVSSEPAVVAAADRANFITDLVGKQIIAPYTNPENIVSGAITTAMTATTSTSLVAAPGAGLRNYITTLIISNAHATVGTDVIIQDGSGGTTLLTIPAAAVYGGAVITLPVPLRQPTTNTALFCANVTTGASVKASAVGFKGV